MKIKPFLSYLFFLLFIFQIRAQPKLTKEHRIKWNGNLAIWENDSMHIYQNNDLGLAEIKESFKWIDSTGTWDLVAETDYIYNHNNCLTSEKLESATYGIKKARQYGGDCRITSETIIKNQGFGTVWVQQTKTDYWLNLAGTIEDFTIYDWLNDSWTDGGEGFNEYDEQGRLIQSYSSVPLNPGINIKVENRLSRFFDSQNRYELVTLELKFPTLLWDTVLEDSIVFHYENDLLVKKSIYRKGNPAFNLSDFIRHEKFEYYCDDILKSSDTEVFGVQGEFFRWRIFFDYDSPVECKTKTDENNLNFRPNPASDFIQIQSPLLAGENAEIRILTTAGVLILREKVENRTENHSLNLPDLPRATYILQILNDRELVAEKLVIF